MSILSYQQALARMLEAAQPLRDIERVATESALGRILARDLVSTLDVPGYDNSAMDGFAVNCSRLSARLQISQRIRAGDDPLPLLPGTAARIFTGAPIPEGADAVVMQEDCVSDGEYVEIKATVRPGLNIRRMGEDVAKGSVMLAAGCKLRPQELGLAASSGYATLPVYRRLKVALFFTGNEIVMPGAELVPGQIYNSNRYSVGAMLEAAGCEMIDLGVVPDDLNATVAALDAAARQADLVLTCGGVSVGEEDHVKAAVERVGELDLWRVAVKPGKPLAFGRVLGKPFIGLPGNPVSALMIFCFFVRPYLLCMQGAAKRQVAGYPVRADFSFAKASSRLEWLRVKLGEGGAALYPNQGSGVLTSMVWADGIVGISPETTVQPGDTVVYYPFAEFLC